MDGGGLQDCTSNPVISILTVTLNAAQQLPGLIESVRLQNLEGIEWVIVDGASTDGTVQQIRDAEDVVTRWVSQPDAGFYDALNKALSMARGRFYIVMGADDRFDEAAFDALRAGVCAADEMDGLVLYPVRRSGRVIRPHKSTRFRWALGWSFVVASHSVGMLIRRKLHQQLGAYSLRYPLLADGHFLGRIFQSGASIKLRDEVIGDFADGGMTSVDKARIAAETWLIQVHLGYGTVLQTVLFLVRVTKSLCRPTST